MKHLREKIEKLTIDTSCQVYYIIRAFFHVGEKGKESVEFEDKLIWIKPIVGISDHLQLIAPETIGHNGVDYRLVEHGPETRRAEEEGVPHCMFAKLLNF